MEEKSSKKGNPLWFIGALAVLIWSFWEGDYGGSVASSLGSLMLPMVFIIAGVRTYMGKKAYFFRILAVTLTALFAIYVISM